MKIHALFFCLTVLIRGGASTRSVLTAMLEANSDPSAVQHRVTDTNFVRVRVEFIICALPVFLGALRICHTNKKLAYCLYFVSSAYLLWATFYRQYYLHYTPVADAAKNEMSLIENYLFVSTASWISSLFLECTSSARFLSLLKTIFSGEYRVRWSCSMVAALVATIFCTGISIYLTVKLEEAVKVSLRYVSDDLSVFRFLYIANRTRCFRQFMEGLTFIIGIATKWENRTSKMVFGRIALTSFVLLFHHSILIYAFVTQKLHVWGVEHYVYLVALSVDVLFRLCVCLWATRNSCCFADREHLGLEMDDHAQREILAPSISNMANSTHRNQSILHDQCSELINQHLNRTCVYQLPTIQQFPPPPDEINHPLIESDVAVGGPFPLTSLETHPHSETSYLSMLSTVTGQLEHLSSNTRLHRNAALVPPPNINVPLSRGSQLVM